MPKVQCPSSVRTGTFAPADVTALATDTRLNYRYFVPLSIIAPRVDVTSALEAVGGESIIYYR